MSNCCITTWREFRGQLTPDLVKVLSILFFLDVISVCGTVFGYVSLLNMYNLLEDTTPYLNFQRFVQTMVNIPWSFCLDFFFKLNPNTLVSSMYFVNGAAIFAYALVIKLELFDPWNRLVVAYFMTLPLHIATNFNSLYLQKHLLIGLSNRYNVTLGIINSSRQMLSSVTHSVYILIVGQVYLFFSLEDATLYMCSFGFLLASGLAVGSYFLFQNYDPVPPRKTSNRTILKNLKDQMSSFWSSRIWKILLSEVLETASIGNNYVTVFFLSAGLGEVDMTYISAMAKVSALISCVLNMVKYKFSWSKRYADCFVIGHFIGLFFNVYVFVAWFMYAWLPWMQGEDLPETPDSMPIWMVVFYTIQLSIVWLTGTMGLIKQEFFQEMIPKEDRGSIAGVKMFLCLLILTFITTVNMILPSDYFYMVNFTMTILIDFVTLAVVVSYKFDEMKWKKEAPFVYEKVPLTADISHDETVLYTKSS